MAVYRFRVFIEDNHEIYRDIEIQGRQNFSDLHRCIVQHFNFEVGQPAEYVTSDSTWYDGDDVIRLDGNLEGPEKRIVNEVSDPHQRFLCVTISFKQVGLALELQKILQEEEGVVYPRCVKSHGDAPFYTQPPIKPMSSDAVPEDDDDAPRSKKKAIVDDEPTDDQIGEEDTDLLNDDTESDPDAPAGDDEDDLGSNDGESEDDEDDETRFSNFDMDEL
jgi:hypothetical protein